MLATMCERESDSLSLLDHRRSVRGADGARRDGDWPESAEVLAAVGPHAVLHVLAEVLLWLNTLLKDDMKGFKIKINPYPN